MDDRKKDERRQPAKKPFQLDISFDDIDQAADVHAVLEDTPQPKGEVYFSNPPRATGAVPSGAPPAGKRKGNRHTGGTITILVVVSLCVSAVLSWLGISTLRDIFALGKDPQDTQEKRISIPAADMTTDQVIDLLADGGLIKQKALCKLYSKFTFKLTNRHNKTPKPPEYLAAEYNVGVSLGLEEMLNGFKEKPQTGETVRLLFQEGITTPKIMQKIGDNKVTGLDTLKRTMEFTDFSNYPFLNGIKSQGRYFPYEGYLFPDTYEFYLSENANNVLRRFFDNFNSRWVNEYDARAGELGMTVDEVVILASIIQMEAANKEQMKDVSGVLHNRLNNAAVYPQLECDSTRDYVANNIAPLMAPGTETYYYDIYNTYKCRGLPAGPICNPGLDAIEAALYPNASEFYFFQHDKNGKIYLSKDKDEHYRVTTDLVSKGLKQ